MKESEKGMSVSFLRTIDDLLGIEVHLWSKIDFFGIEVQAIERDFS